MNDLLSKILIILSGFLLSTTITLAYLTYKQEKTQEDSTESLECNPKLNQCLKQLPTP